MAKKSQWLPISKAPRDGTVILVTETPNGEHWNVLPAAYMNQGGDGKVIGWWCVIPSRYTSDGGDCPLPVRWKPLASHPVCWMPMPISDPVATLRRRLSASLRKQPGESA